MLTVTKEPQHARFTTDKVMIKDHYYYKGNGFSWSKPARVNEKYYPFFHKQQDENKERIKNMKQQDIEDKKLYEEIRREKLIEKKYLHRSVFENRVKEREVIQRMSNQHITSQNNLETEEDNKTVYEIVAKRLNSGKDLRSDEFSWNLLTKASKKNVEIFLGSYSLKGEEEMIQKIKERIEEEKKEELIEQKRQSDIHQKLRQIFIARQEENIAKEELISRPATAQSATFQIRKSKIHYDNTQKTNSGDIKKIETYGSATELKQQNSIITPRSQGKDIRISSATSMQRLAVSREGVKREFKIDSTEMKGMLVQNMDKKKCLPGNNFYDALTQSKVFQEILDEDKNNTRKLDSSRRPGQTRPTTSITSVTLQSRPMTSMPKFSSPVNQYSPSINMHSNLISSTPKNKLETRSLSVAETDDFNAMQEINTFENMFCRGSKKNAGYARVSLEEAYRLTSTQGLVALQRVETKKQQQIVN